MDDVHDAEVLAPTAYAFSGLGENRVEAAKMTVVRVLFHRAGTPEVAQPTVDRVALLLAAGVIAELPAYALGKPFFGRFKVARPIDRMAYSYDGTTHVCCELLTNLIWDEMASQDCGNVGRLMRDVLRPLALRISDNVFGDREAVQLVFGYRGYSDVRFGY